MKLYFVVEEANYDSFLEFCEVNKIQESASILPYGRFYCIDTVSRTWYPDTFKTIPVSWRLDWDPVKADNLLNNKIIGRFNEGKLQWSLMNSDAMAPMIQVLMYGAKKYDRDNWKKACPSRLDLMDSLQRHALKIIDGESIDPESGLPHIGHLMCNAMFYSYWEQKTNGQFENYVDTDVQL